MALGSFHTACGRLTPGTAGFSLPGNNSDFCSRILQRNQLPAGGPAHMESLSYVMPSQPAEDASAGAQPLVVNLLMQLNAANDARTSLLRTQQTIRNQLTVQLHQAMTRLNGSARAQASRIEHAVRNSLYREGEFEKAIRLLERELKKNGNEPLTRPPTARQPLPAAPRQKNRRPQESPARTASPLRPTSAINYTAPSASRPDRTRNRQETPGTRTFRTPEQTAAPVPSKGTARRSDRTGTVQPPAGPESETRTGARTRKESQDSARESGTVSPQERTTASGAPSAAPAHPSRTESPSRPVSGSGQPAEKKESRDEEPARQRPDSSAASPEPSVPTETPRETPASGQISSVRTRNLTGSSGFSPVSSADTPRTAAAATEMRRNLLRRSLEAQPSPARLTGALPLSGPLSPGISRSSPGGAIIYRQTRTASESPQPESDSAATAPAAPRRDGSGPAQIGRSPAAPPQKQNNLRREQLQNLNQTTPASPEARRSIQTASSLPHVSAPRGPQILPPRQSDSAAAVRQPQKEEPKGPRTAAQIPSAGSRPGTVSGTGSVSQTEAPLAGAPIPPAQTALAGSQPGTVSGTGSVSQTEAPLAGAPVPPAQTSSAGSHPGTTAGTGSVPGQTAAPAVPPVQTPAAHSLFGALGLRSSGLPALQQNFTPSADRQNILTIRREQLLQTFTQTPASRFQPEAISAPGTRIPAAQISAPGRETLVFRQKRAPEEPDGQAENRTVSGSLRTQAPAAPTSAASAAEPVRGETGQTRSSTTSEPHTGSVPQTSPVPSSQPARPSAGAPALGAIGLWQPPRQGVPAAARSHLLTIRREQLLRTFSQTPASRFQPEAISAPGTRIHTPQIAAPGRENLIFRQERTPEEPDGQAENRTVSGSTRTQAPATPTPAASAAEPGTGETGQPHSSTTSEPHTGSVPRMSPVPSSQPARPSAGTPAMGAIGLWQPPRQGVPAAAARSHLLTIRQEHLLRTLSEAPVTRIRPETLHTLGSGIPAPQTFAPTRETLVFRQDRAPEQTASEDTASEDTAVSPKRETGTPSRTASGSQPAGPQPTARQSEPARPQTAGPVTQRGFTPAAARPSVQREQLLRTFSREPAVRFRPETLTSLHAASSISPAPAPAAGRENRIFRQEREAEKSAAADTASSVGQIRQEAPTARPQAGTAGTEMADTAPVSLRTSGTISRPAVSPSAARQDILTIRREQLLRTFSQVPFTPLRPESLHSAWMGAASAPDFAPGQDRLVFRQERTPEESAEPAEQRTVPQSGGRLPAEAARPAQLDRSAPSVSGRAGSFRPQTGRGFTASVSGAAYPEVPGAVPQPAHLAGAAASDLPGSGGTPTPAAAARIPSGPAASVPARQGLLSLRTQPLAFRLSEFPSAGQTSGAAQASSAERDTRVFRTPTYPGQSHVFPEPGSGDGTAGYTAVPGASPDQAYASKSARISPWLTRRWGLESQSGWKQTDLPLRDPQSRSFGTFRPVTFRSANPGVSPASLQGQIFRTPAAAGPEGPGAAPGSGLQPQTRSASARTAGVFPALPAARALLAGAQDAPGGTSYSGQTASSGRRSSPAPGLSYRSPAETESQPSGTGEPRFDPFRGQSTAQAGSQTSSGRFLQRQLTRIITPETRASVPGRDRSSIVYRTLFRTPEQSQGTTGTARSTARTQADIPTSSGRFLRDRLARVVTPETRASAPGTDRVSTTYQTLFRTPEPSSPQRSGRTQADMPTASGRFLQNQLTRVITPETRSATPDTNRANTAYRTLFRTPAAEPGAAAPEARTSGSRTGQAPEPQRRFSQGTPIQGSSMEGFLSALSHLTSPDRQTENEEAGRAPADTAPAVVSQPATSGSAWTPGHPNAPGSRHLSFARSFARRQSNSDPGGAPLSHFAEPVSEPAMVMPESGTRSAASQHGPARNSSQVIYRKPMRIQIPEQKHEEKSADGELTGEAALLAQTLSPNGGPTSAPVHGVYTVESPQSRGYHHNQSPQLSQEQEDQLVKELLGKINLNRITDQLMDRIERRLRSERRKIGLQ